VEVIQRLAVLVRSAVARIRRDERGFTTAELMANAALAILALVVIWAALQALGVDVVNWIRGQILK
jgi:Tfp pilus assembly protein FimT